MKTITKYLIMKWNSLSGKRCLLIIPLIGIMGCTAFVEVDPPKNIMVSETVFNDPSTVESAMADLYFTMRESGMVSGNYGFTTRLAIYSDELDYYGFNPQLLEFYQNRVLPPNTEVLAWWSEAYKVIYGANAIVEGIEGATDLEESEQDRFMGQALFVRAFMHSLLVSVFGDVPYITTTDYAFNNQVSRMSEDLVYEGIISDLVRAVGLMENSTIENEERLVPDRNVAKALLARVYLYTDQWDLAEAEATDVIGNFGLEDELGMVFLKESMETIWQLQHGEFPGNTQEASQLIIPFVPGQSFALTDGLLSAFEDGDGRRSAWIDSISNEEQTITLYYPYKYKARFDVTESLEYSIHFRLAEQYLIRSEARTRIGNLIGASEDLNMIRNRAGLANTTANSESELLEAILAERRVELFTEQGHRWFDLRRTGRATAVLGMFKPDWEDTDVLFPIPEIELEANPNLLPQNQGY
ncbi:MULTISPECIES: RagB/SusD family nutrient uptake outer membrane protein [unclassified Allomuricauda]|uniref:RagB/SusD family nutrient uptake outer membrane protein n=1 Tax=unclassified Allomuricauda TaxID=2615049 RepID=UPI0009F207F2|nr:MULTISPECIES: RagB/SusD family nutrient uptake outer membrane protein [unclassified Allomuricauda]MCK0160087.1 RagB/SusD family nutrient uptake outer membrane protein [Muricauda sp. F6463D]